MKLYEWHNLESWGTVKKDGGGKKLVFCAGNRVISWN